jgi:hypothetical protein
MKHGEAGGASRVLKREVTALGRTARKMMAEIE